MDLLPLHQVLGTLLLVALVLDLPLGLALVQLLLRQPHLLQCRGLANTTLRIVIRPTLFKINKQPRLIPMPRSGQHYFESRDPANTT